MKIGNIPRKETPTRHPAILPLILEDIDKDSRTYVSHSLRTDPADADSPTYKQSTLVLTGTETVREIIGHPVNVAKVLVGLNVTEIANKVTIAKTLLKGNALTQFNAGVQQKCTARMENRILTVATEAEAEQIHERGWDHAGNYHNDDFPMYFQYMVKQLIPAKALAKVKRQIRRNTRKPTDMSIRTYYQNLFRINDQEIPHLPPFSEDSKFRDDELVDIITFGTPKGWAREMDRQGFDPMDHSIDEVIDFMEQLEQADAFDNDPKKEKSSSNSKKKASKGSGSSKKELKYCELHGEGSHSTAECRTLSAKKKAKKSDNSDGHSKSHNKTWKRKADDESSKSKNEVAMLIKKLVKKELSSADKKRSKKRKSSDDDSSSDEEGFLAELHKDGSLNDFNYDDLANMNIDSSDEVSV